MPAIAVQGDIVSGTCPTHMIPNPTSGVPQPGPPMPFSAPITVGAVPTVTVGGKPVLVIGASGTNSSVHVGLHAADPAFTPTVQQAKIVNGSTTVTVGGKPVATATSTCTMCVPGAPGTLAATGVTVEVGA